MHLTKLAAILVAFLGSFINLICGLKS